MHGPDRHAVGWALSRADLRARYWLNKDPKLKDKQQEMNKRAAAAKWKPEASVWRAKEQSDISADTDADFLRLFQDVLKSDTTSCT